MALDLQNVAKLLEATLDPRQNRQGMFRGPLEAAGCRGNIEYGVLTCTAELALEQEAVKDGFSLLLLQIVANQSHPYVTRLAGALCFKNLIKRKWKVSEHLVAFCATVSADLKAEILAG